MMPRADDNNNPPQAPRAASAYWRARAVEDRRRASRALDELLGISQPDRSEVNQDRQLLTWPESAE